MAAACSHQMKPLALVWVTPRSFCSPRLVRPGGPAGQGRGAASRPEPPGCASACRGPPPAPARAMRPSPPPASPRASPRPAAPRTTPPAPAPSVNASRDPAIVPQLGHHRGRDARASRAYARRRTREVPFWGPRTARRGPRGGGGGPTGRTAAPTALRAGGGSPRTRPGARGRSPERRVARAPGGPLPASPGSASGFGVPVGVPVPAPGVGPSGRGGRVAGPRGRRVPDTRPLGIATLRI